MKLPYAQGMPFSCDATVFVGCHKQSEVTLKASWCVTACDVLKACKAGTPVMKNVFEHFTCRNNTFKNLLLGCK